MFHIINLTTGNRRVKVNIGDARPLPMRLSLAPEWIVNYPHKSWVAFEASDLWVNTALR
jgi:hypothetical protein